MNNEKYVTQFSDFKQEFKNRFQDFQKIIYFLVYLLLPLRRICELICNNGLWGTKRNSEIQSLYGKPDVIGFILSASIRWFGYSIDHRRMIILEGFDSIPSILDSRQAQDRCTWICKNLESTTGEE